MSGFLKAVMVLCAVVCVTLIALVVPAEAGGRNRGGNDQVFVVRSQAANHCTHRGGGNDQVFVVRGQSFESRSRSGSAVIQTEDRRFGPFGIFGRSRSQTTIIR